MFKTFYRFKYQEIDKKELTNGLVGVCRTNNFDDPFEIWDYAVFEIVDCQTYVLGLFKTREMAERFGRTF